jgi:type I restriction enzyme S subunit
VQQTFVRLLAPFWAGQQETDNESSTLAAIRDALLPQLISGELRVRDAERFVGSVA